LHDGSSLFDHFGEGFTLLVRPGTSATAFSSAVRDAARLSVPFKLLHIDNPAVASLYSEPLTLIRPDQHIAWTGTTWPAHAVCDVLAMATGQMTPGTVDSIAPQPLEETVHE
jgi:hypothetical protein